MKARKVKGLDVDGPLAANARRIVMTRLAELCDFWPRAADPAEVTALHDMRIAAKRLRYVLEVMRPCFGPYAKDAVERIKALQDLLGEIHDCDVQIPEVAEFLAVRMATDAESLAAGREAPHRAEYAGLVGLLVDLQARRSRLFDGFLASWGQSEVDDFRARLEEAVTA